MRFKTKTILGLLLLILALGLSACGEAPGLRGEVSIDGEPQVSANVILEGDAGTETTTSTDGKGRFSFTDLAADTYILTVEVKWSTFYCGFVHADLALSEGESLDLGLHIDSDDLATDSLKWLGDDNGFLMMCIRQ
jgi:hypothetical protein